MLDEQLRSLEGDFDDIELDAGGVERLDSTARGSCSAPSVSSSGAVSWCSNHYPRSISRSSMRFSDPHRAEPSRGANVRHGFPNMWRENVRVLPAAYRLLGFLGRVTVETTKRSFALTGTSLARLCAADRTDRGHCRSDRGSPASCSASSSPIRAPISSAVRRELLTVNLVATAIG